MAHKYKGHVLHGSKKLRLRDKIWFKYRICIYPKTQRYILIFYLEVPEGIITNLFANIIRQKDPTVDYQALDTFMVPEELYPKILMNKRLHSWINQVQTKRQGKDPGFRFASRAISKDGMYYKKGDDGLYHVTIQLQGDYVYS